MNNDKLLIIVLVLTLYLTCFRRSEGQETEMVCQYNPGQLDDIIDAKLDGLGVGNFADWVTKINNHGHNVSEVRDVGRSAEHKSHSHGITHSHGVTVTGMT